MRDLDRRNRCALGELTNKYFVNWDTVSSWTPARARYLKREILVRANPKGGLRLLDPHVVCFIAHSNGLIAGNKPRIFRVSARASMLFESSQ